MDDNSYYRVRFPCGFQNMIANAHRASAHIIVVISHFLTFILSVTYYIIMLVNAKSRCNVETEYINFTITKL